MSAAGERIDGPPILLTNDDGISSFFLRALAESLSARWPVCVVAPADEQSWSGRSVSRSGDCAVRSVEGWPGPAWSVAGTPTDCANLGLYQLLGERPRAVVSGMNLGFNVTLPLILSSGTVAGAIEGALAGLPAVATSLALPQEEFFHAKRHAGRRGEAGDARTRAAAERVRVELESILAAPASERPLVHNINLPDGADLQTEKRSTRPALLKTGSLFSLEGGSARFQFPVDFLRDAPAGSDLEAVMQGAVSHSVLALDQLGVLPS